MPLLITRLTRLALGSLCLAPLLLNLSGCSFTKKPSAGPSAYQEERFQSNENFSRLFDSSAQQACEAARLTLLSQGYVISNADGSLVSGEKRFQPDGENHLEITFNVVCVADSKDNKVATAYVSAQQDRYAVKKSASATSLGVSAIGSISLPLSSSEDSLVKVGSETITAGSFYDRFFKLMNQKLSEINDSN